MKLEWCTCRKERRTVTPAGPIAPIDEKTVWAKPLVVPRRAGVGEEHEMKMNIAPVEKSGTKLWQQYIMHTECGVTRQEQE